MIYFLSILKLKEYRKTALCNKQLSSSFKLKEVVKVAKLVIDFDKKYDEALETNKFIIDKRGSKFEFTK